MKRLHILIAVVMATLLLWACDASFSPTSISKSEQAKVKAGLAKFGDHTIDHTAIVLAGTIDASQDGQELSITFDEKIDESTIASAISFYVLKAAPETTAEIEDGAYARKRILTPNATEVVYLTGNTTITYTFNLASATDISDPIEAVIDASILTADEGAWKLNTDGDNFPGESPDDDLYGYLPITNEHVTATGAQRNPRDRITMGATLPAVDQTAITANVQFDSTGAVAPYPKVTSALLNSHVNLLTYNSATDAWDALTTTGTYDDTTGVYSITQTILDGVVYKITLSDPYELQETATTRGFMHRYSYNQNLGDVVIMPPDVSFAAQADSNYYQGVNTAALFDAAGVTVYFDSDDRNGYIEIDFSASAGGVNLNEGIDIASITPDTFKLYISTLNHQKYVPWVSKEVYTIDGDGTTQKNDGLRLMLSPTYKKQSLSLELHIGPTVRSLRDSSVSDDMLYLGDQSNVETTYPYKQFRVYNTGEQI